MSAAIFSESTAIRLGLKRQVVTALLFSLAANVLLSGILLVKPSPVLTIVIPPEAASAEAGWIFTEKGFIPNTSKNGRCRLQHSSQR